MNNEEILEAFECCLREEKNTSQNTRLSYLRDVRQLLLYYPDKELEEIAEAEIAAFFCHIREEGCSEATIARKAAAIRCLSAFLARDSGKETEIHIELPKQKRKIPEILSPEELQLLLAQPDRSEAKGLRDSAMLELLYASGMRAGELIALDVSDFNSSTELIRIRSVAEERFIPLYPEALRLITDYLRRVRPNISVKPDEKALFLNMSGERMTRQGFWKTMQYYQKKAGIKKPVNPQLLRNTFAAQLLENGADINTVQELLGLSEKGSASIYRKLVKKKLKDVYNKAHPKAVQE